VKRVFDFIAASIGLLLLSPLLLVIYFLVRNRLGSPVLFSQIRPGLHGKPFKIHKFRTMTDKRDENGKLLCDAKRLTTFGRFLRSTSLDELPELVNVLKGEMSLVGPRPLLMEYLDRYTPTQARRNEVKPGITGWAQVNGRQNIMFSKRLEYDVWYVDHQSFILDLKILLLTFYCVFKSEGVISGQDVQDVDDLGLNETLSSKNDSKRRKSHENRS
jgi:sugar transferase EpsL